MAKKRKPRSERNINKRKTGARGPDSIGPLPDRRIIETSMRQMLGGLGPAADTPLGRAQEFLDQAFRETSPHRRVELARKALEASPDCADAYVLLAEHAPNRAEALALYETALAAAERTLGPEMFQEGVGHFWGILQTRPYMRARLGLANLLWVHGRREEAVGHLQDMLRLNPNDNQGVRYALAGHLLALNRDADLAALLDQYPHEGSAAWAYNRVLLAFRREGDTPQSRRLLDAARKANKHVIDYLTGRKYPPLEMPDHYSPGKESEAIIYVADSLAGWKAAGAIAWLRSQDREAAGKAAAPQPHGPLPMVKRWLTSKLTQDESVFEVGFAQLPEPVRAGGELVRPWLVLVADQLSGAILAHAMPQEVPSTNLLWDTLIQAMQSPLAGEAHRPAEVRVSPGEPWEPLRPHLDEVGVRLTAVERVKEVETALHQAIEALGLKPRPGLLDSPGVTPELAGRFYEAAAHYFRAEPWTHVGFESAVKVECDRFESGPWYASLFGQSGLSTGVALYENLSVLRRLVSGEGSDRDARASVALTVTYGEEEETPAADVAAARRHGWQVARPDAYPHLFHKDRGMTMRLPLAWEVELMEGCLRALPDFVAQQPQSSPVVVRVTVPVASGELPLELAWVSLVK
jgi:tetratricopeptide (TPR) repeat protein